MRNACLHKVSAWGLLAPTAFLAPGALAQTATGDNPNPPQLLEPDHRPNWSQHVRLGALAGLNINADFHMSGGFGISSTATPGVYDDGYVRVDNTGDAQGLTSFWGYNSASQLSGSTLTLHKTTSFTTSGGDTREDNPYSFGVELGYGQSYWRWGRASLGWDFGFGWLPIGITDERTLPATLTRGAFQFDTGGITVPTAPYNGGPSGEGPVIRDTATPAGTETITGTVSGSRKLDVSLFTFKLGPTLNFDLSRSFALAASAGPALGLVTGDYKFNETLTTSTGATENTGKIGASKLVYGGYVSAMLLYHFPSEDADLYLGAQYMPLGSATVGNEGREARLNLGGQINLSAGINWSF